MLLICSVRKGVGIHRVEAKAERVGVCLQPCRVFLIPRNMKRDSGRGSRQLVDDSAVIQLVENTAWFAEARKAGKACAAGSNTPGWDGHMELGNLGRYRIDIDVAA